MNEGNLDISRFYRAAMRGGDVSSTQVSRVAAFLEEQSAICGAK